MRHRLSAAVPILALCLLLAACGEAVATRSLAEPPTPTRTNTPVRPTATVIPPTATNTQAPRAASTAQPTLSPTSPRATTAPTRTSIPRPSPPAGVVAIPAMGASHVNEGQPLVLAHSPPSSGTHYPTALRAGIYRQEANPGNWIHSLEHGYVVALVKCNADCAAIFSQLDAIYATRLRGSNFGNVKFIATPYSQPYTKGDAQIALVAWGNELLLPTFDADTLVRFYESFVDQGPEAVP